MYRSSYSGKKRQKSLMRSWRRRRTRLPNRSWTSSRPQDWSRHQDQLVNPPSGALAPLFKLSFCFRPQSPSSIPFTKAFFIMLWPYALFTVQGCSWNSRDRAETATWRRAHRSASGIQRLTIFLLIIGPRSDHSLPMSLTD